MANFKQPPIVRHEALAPLSRDHYVGLVQARHLILAADEDDVARRKAVEEFIDAWEREIAVHFRDEERLLSALMDEKDRQRLLDEHARLTELATKVCAQRRQIDPDPLTLREFGQSLEQHIRWEERELFSRIQDRMNPSRLDELQKQTVMIETSRPRTLCRTRTDADRSGA